MMQWARKWGRRLLWVLPAMLAIYVLAELADHAWFRARVPIAFREANWSGSWRTTHRGGLSGRLLVKLPDPLPEGEDFRAEAVVYYPIFSVWKTGQFVPMEFAGRLDPGDASSGGRSANEIPPAGLLKFKGMAGRQVVEYAALVDETRSRITGGYLSSHPYDVGQFSLRND